MSYSPEGRSFWAISANCPNTKPDKTEKRILYRIGKLKKEIKNNDMEGGILSGEMKLFLHHIYELQKGIRYMALSTIDHNDVAFAIQRLQKLGIDYVLHPVNARRLNLFFGKKECIGIVRQFCDRPLNQLTPEEDFILGTMLGYDICQQCERYSHKKKPLESA